MPRRSFSKSGFSVLNRLAPSCPARKNLAGAMANWLPADPEAFVLELGPGTGAVTQALVERGLRQDRLVAIEQSSKLPGCCGTGSARPHHHRRRLPTGSAADETRPQA